MPLGVPLSTLRRELRAETGTSLNPLQGIAVQQSLDLILDRQQRELWDAYTWRHLRIYRNVTLAAGQGVYSYPEDIPFDQVMTMWFADGLSGRWRPLTYGITLGMVPPAGPMRGTPCRWDNVEGSDLPIEPPVEPGNTAPTITSNGGGPTANMFLSPGEQVVTTVTATDPDVGQTLTYSIIGGTHAGLFIIHPSTGMLTFVSPSVDGTYNVIVQVSDGHGGTDSQDITVAVGLPRSVAPSPYTIVPTNPIGQFMLLPMPASSDMLLRVEGQAAINPLVADNDRCVIDSRLITLFAAAEVLANQKSEGAAMKLTKAQNYLRQLLKNQAATKRVNYNMGGSLRFGNDPSKQRAVPYLDCIPS